MCYLVEKTQVQSPCEFDMWGFVEEGKHNLELKIKIDESSNWKSIWNNSGMQTYLDGKHVLLNSMSRTVQNHVQIQILFFCFFAMGQ